MKKKTIYHPKLYLSIANTSGTDYKLDFLANRFDGSGHRLLEFEIVKSNQLSFNDNILFNLNKIELKNLNVFISRQNKVIEIYKKKDELDRMKVVQNSLNIFLDFKRLFDDWFQNNSKSDNMK